MRTPLKIRLGLFLLLYGKERQMQILVISVPTSFSGWLICQTVSVADLKEKVFTDAQRKGMGK